ncbi:MAG: DNA repair protein [Xanthomonadales bacterium]|nr:DNA repair protein [Xanthomonadales bacterium]
MNRFGQDICRALLSLALAVGLAACQTIQYEALEAVGIEKRGILEARVEAASEAQDEAGEQFETTLERFRSVVEFDGGDLERAYRRLNREYERSVDRAGAVSQRIEAVESVAEDLFAEWEEELERYSSADLRARSRELLEATRTRYASMVRAMRRAERTIDPVLQAFEDQVLFLKHNLNSMAVESIRGELGEIEAETEALLTAMRDSIEEADRFIETLN